MQIILFLTLGLLVFPSKVVPLMGIGLLISAFLILIARPLSVFISLSFFKVKNRSRWFVSWVGLRGAVPIVFATYPLLAGIDKSQVIFNIVFFISLTSVMIQGTTLSMVAKWLHVALPEKAKPKSPTDSLLQDGIKSELIEILIAPQSQSVGKRIVDLNFPKSAVIPMIKRNDKFLTPSGATIIEGNDILMILLTNKESLALVNKALSLTNQN